MDKFYHKNPGTNFSYTAAGVLKYPTSEPATAFEGFKEINCW